MVFSQFCRAVLTSKGAKLYEKREGKKLLAVVLGCCHIVLQSNIEQHNMPSELKGDAVSEVLLPGSFGNSCYPCLLTNLPGFQSLLTEGIYVLEHSELLTKMLPLQSGFGFGLTRVILSAEAASVA